MKKQTLAKNVGKRIKDRRTELKLSQAKLAQRVGGEAKQICYYEKGATLPGTEILSKLAKALNTSLDYLVFGDVKGEAKNLIGDRELLRQFELTTKLNEEDKNYVKKLLDGLIIQNQLNNIIPQKS